MVIANEDHPFTFTPDEPGLFFVEGVCAGGEVKSLLTSAQLQTSLESSRKWKKLRINPGKGTMICTNEADRDRFYVCPPYFLIAMESQLSLDAVQQRVANEGSFCNAPRGNILDAVFLLDRGWVIDFGSGRGVFQYRSLHDGTSLEGWHRNRSEKVLFDLLAWLHGCMPKMARWESLLMSYLNPSPASK